MDILTGTVSPAGRLPNTWPASLDEVKNVEAPLFLFILLCDYIDSKYHRLHNGEQNISLF